MCIKRLNKIKNSAKNSYNFFSSRKLGGSVPVLVLVILSVLNQWNHNLVYWLQGRENILQRLSLSDSQRHYQRLPDVFSAVRQIKGLPEDSVLYFVPLFSNTKGAEKNRFWWWHLNHILRYFCYPRRILTLHFDLYQRSKKEFMHRFMQDRRTFTDLDWVKSRGITHLIVYRDNRISILPVSQPVRF